MQTIDFQMAAAEPSSAADMPASVRKSLRFARRIIVKIGTPVATHVDGNIALGRIAGIVEQIAMLRQEGRNRDWCCTNETLTHSPRLYVQHRQGEP